MKMSPTLEDAGKILSDVWGYDSFRPLQTDSIQCVLSKIDSLTVLPTGGGKSICFQIPAICLDGMAVVVSPLISLMKDQVDSLVANGVPAAFVNSSQSAAEQQAVAKQIQTGSLKLLYVSPERLLTPKMLTFLETAKLSFFAIDEAHCISAWGHDFRPEYRDLKVLKQRFPGTSVHAFTATASEPVRTDIASQLGIADATMLVGNFDRPNLVYRMLPSNNRIQQVVDVIQRHKGESGIVYCISRKEVEKTASVLKNFGCSALPYHAGLSDADRVKHQDAFIKEKCDVIVATVAFGMGIDKSNVRFVVHAGIPKSIEHYQQESGRAGRDGLESECILIYSPGDVVTWKRIISGDNKEAYQNATRSLDAIAGFCSSPVCRHKSLVEFFGQPYTKPSCNACDVCLQEVELVADPITISQKIISCVARLNQNFGAAHTAKVLTGSQEQRIVQLGHDQLSTHGILAEEGSLATKMWIEQLIQQGYLLRSGEYQVLSITSLGRKLLKREGSPQLSTPVAMEKGRTDSPSEESWDDVDRGLFEELRVIRRDLAAQKNLPAYVIFGDRTLRELAKIRPTSNDGFGRIKGIGQRKKDDYATQFVEKIRSYCEVQEISTDLFPMHGTEHKSEQIKSTSNAKSSGEALNSSAVAAFAYFEKGQSIEAVAQQMNRAASTVSGYLTQYLQTKKITDNSPWVDQATSQQIIENLHRLEDNRIKPLYEHFEGQISYEAIRITLQCWRNQQPQDKSNDAASK